jgi:hypothetical protein
MKSMMAELTDSTNIAQGLVIPQGPVYEVTHSSQSTGFALMPVVFSIGATIGYRNYYILFDVY